VVYRGSRNVEVCEQLPDPVVGDDRDAVVRVTWSGICGTDLHPYRGEIPGFAPGTVLGHEFAGTVVDAGPATQFRAGDRVFASDVVACGRCGPCGRGWHYQCERVSLFGYSTVVGDPVDGGQAELVRVPFADVVLARTPDGVTDEQALFVGDVLTTAWTAVEAGGVLAGDVVAVVGAGPLGVLCALCAQAVGAAPVLVCDGDPRRRERAAAAGLQVADPAGFPALVQEAAGRGAHVVIEAVGSDAALACALGVAGPRATVVAVGAHHSTAFPFPSGTAFAKELTVRFAVGDPIRSRDRVLALLRAGRVDPLRVVTHRLPLSEAARGYELLDRREALKVLLRVTADHQ
jgi:threonine dehydrogenase-like Zn-dependent dehydrogenase